MRRRTLSSETTLLERAARLEQLSAQKNNVLACHTVQIYTLVIPTVLSSNNQITIQRFERILAAVFQYSESVIPSVCLFALCLSACLPVNLHINTSKRYSLMKFAISLFSAFSNMTITEF